jgi:glutathione S-transferase
MLTFYYSPGSSSMAVHIALLETGAAFESKRLDFEKKEQRQPAYLAINPAGKVPTLVIDGRPLTEVAGILFYLARRYPDARLLPAPDAEFDARAISWMSWVASTLHPARRQGAEHTQAVYRITETKLGGREWALGEYSIADIHLFRLVWRARDLLEPIMAELPGLAAHYQRMMARPAVKRVIEIESAGG